mmetsp:Transcript_27706/g.51663  ORF Transcript_27706/g.51663 Transcript_27706/m.51663 type:complete len:142 (+) Transcript_27706:2350-2775(+)
MLFSKKHKYILPLYLIKKSWYLEEKYCEYNYCQKKNTKSILNNNFYSNFLDKNLIFPISYKYKYIKKISNNLISRKSLYTEIVKVKNMKKNIKIINLEKKIKNRYNYRDRINITYGLLKDYHKFRVKEYLFYNIIFLKKIN